MQVKVKIAYLAAFNSKTFIWSFFFKAVQVPLVFSLSQKAPHTLKDASDAITGCSEVEAKVFLSPLLSMLQDNRKFPLSRSPKFVVAARVDTAEALEELELLLLLTAQ